MHEPTDQLLQSVDANKREFIGKLVRTGAFIAPVVASFSMASVASTNALAANNSNPV